MKTRTVFQNKISVLAMTTVMGLGFSIELKSSPNSVKSVAKTISNARQELLGDMKTLSREYVMGKSELVNQISIHLKKRLRVKKTFDFHKFAKVIVEESLKHSFDPLFALAVMRTESTYNPRARGSIGEIGLMQIRPCTANWIAKKLGLPPVKTSELYDPTTNIVYSLAYFSYLKKKFNKKGERFVQAYNMGPTALRRALNRGRKPIFYYSKVVTHYKQIKFSVERQKTQYQQASIH